MNDNDFEQVQQKLANMMARQNKQSLDYVFTAIMDVNGKTYLVDSRETFDNGYELMVFECDKHFDNVSEKHFDVSRGWLKENSIIPEEVYEHTDFTDLYAQTYSTVEEAEKDFDGFVEDSVKLYRALQTREVPEWEDI